MWQPYQAGLGRVETDSEECAGRNKLIRLHKPESPSGDIPLTYTNAQIDDYHTLRRRDFWWSPPLRMKLRAQFSHPSASSPNHDPTAPHLTGTAGFGFWNDPFVMTGQNKLGYGPTLPRALWFFYASPPSDMPLAMGVPGWGWKAAVIDCFRPAFYALLPTAPIGVLLMRSSFLYRRLWPIAQAAMNVDECIVGTSLTAWRTYEIEWLEKGVRFWVDDRLVFETRRSPRGPLGMVIWLDNQSMVVTPTGRFRSGLVPSHQDELLEVENLEIEQLTI